MKRQTLESIVASMCRELREIAWSNNHDIPPSTRAGSVLDDLGQNEAFMREIQEDPQFDELREYLDQKSARAKLLAAGRLLLRACDEGDADMAMDGYDLLRAAIAEAEGGDG
jgi:hypothetical protein